MSRLNYIKKNLIFNVIKYVAQLLLQFVLRTALIYIMGAEYLGLNGLFTNVFAFLNLAELGIGSAIVFSMYKPIADGDTEKVKALQNLYKKFYLIISLVVFCLGIILLPFLKFLINGDVTVDINIYVLYILYLINTIVGYFAAHKRSLLFAYQRGDVENKVKTFSLFGMTILQIIALFLTRNYYVFFSVNILFTIIECIAIQKVANKIYPEINGKSESLDKDTKKEISKNVAALSMHKIGSVIVYSTDNILISSILGLVVLGAYSNYYLIISSLIAFFTLFSNTLTSSAGNLVASKDIEYVYGKYKIINFLFSLLSTFSTVCLLVLFQPFIKVWTGGGVYLLDFSTVVLICISFYVARQRSATMIFRDATGLFWQGKLAPIFEAVINLVFSIIFGLIWGINGVVFGTILSTVLVPLWVEPMVLHKHYFKKNVFNYFKTYVLDFVVLISVAICSYFVCSFIPDSGILMLIVKFAVCGILTAVLLLIFSLPRKEFKETIKWSKEIMHNFKQNKNKDID